MRQALGARLQRADPAFLGLLAAAALARVAILLATRHLVLVNDPADYQRLATSLVHGHGFGTTAVAPGGGPTAFRPPLWPLFLAGVYAVTGVHVMAARAVQVALGVLTVGLVGALADRLWGRPARLWASGLAAVYPPLLLAGASVLSESLSLPLMLGTLLAADSARREPRAGTALRWCALSGVLAGLDILCRPDSFVVLLPAAALALGWRRPRPTAPAARAGVLLAAAVLAVTPWLIRDAVVMGRFVPVTTQGGLVASGTYNDTAAHDPSHPAAWRPTNLVPGYTHLLRGDEVQEEAALRSAALHYIRTHPAYPLRVAGWNLLRLFDLTGVSTAEASWAANGIRPGLGRLDAWGLAGLVGVLAASALVAVAAGRRRRPFPPSVPGPGALWWTPVLVALVTIPVLGESRLRVGLDPFLVLAAGGAVAEAAAALRARLRPRPAPVSPAPVARSPVSTA